MAWTKPEFEACYTRLKNQPEERDFWTQFPLAQLGFVELRDFLDATLERLAAEWRHDGDQNHIAVLVENAETIFHVLKVDLPTMGLAQVAQYMGLFARHSIVPSKALMIGIKERIREFPTITEFGFLSSLINSFASLNEPPGAELVELFSTSVMGLKKRLTVHDIGRLAGAFSIFEASGSSEAGQMLIYALQKDTGDCARAFNGLQADNLSPLMGNEQAREQAVQTILDLAKAERIPDDQNLPADLGFEWRERRFFIQFDKTEDFVYDLTGFYLRYRGQVLLQSALLKHALPRERIIRIGQEGIEAICRDELSMVKFLSMTLCLPADIYTANAKADGGVSLGSILPGRSPFVESLNLTAKIA